MLFGIIIGAFIFTIIFIVYIYYNLLTVIQFSWPRANIFLIILMFAALAIGEEFIFRSFFINGLRIYIKSTSFILIISAIFFSLVHWFNKGSTVLSALSAFIGGFMYAYAFVKTDKLWLPIGLHFSWNFFQSFVYGFPVSGYVFEGIFKVNISGQELWTGGAYGPEGSLIGILGRFFVIFTIWFIIK
jgi:membrane protease YdiL (CAAX protease family)